MAHNLTITVGDELWDSMQKCRKRLKIAQICQKALQAEVNKFEQLPKGVINMETIIERLREEKKEFESDSYTKGYEQGLKWAQEASFSDLSHYADLKELLSSTILPDQLFIPEDEIEFKRDIEQAEETEYDWVEFQKGWLAAVIYFWDTVSDKI